MGYNVSKPPFDLTEFLSQKATKRVVKRRFASFTRAGSPANGAKPKDELQEPPKAPPVDRT